MKIIESTKFSGRSLISLWSIPNILTTTFSHSSRISKFLQETNFSPSRSSILRRTLAVHERIKIRNPRFWSGINYHVPNYTKRKKKGKKEKSYFEVMNLGRNAPRRKVQKFLSPSLPRSTVASQKGSFKRRPRSFMHVSREFTCTTDQREVAWKSGGWPAKEKGAWDR